MNSTVKRALIRLSGVAICLSLLELAIRAGLIASRFVPRPTAVAYAFGSNAQYILASSLVTIRNIFVGFFIGSTLGVSAGIVLGWSRNLYLSFSPLLYLFSTIPFITFLPLFIIWFGLGIGPIFATTILAAFFPVLMGAMTAVQRTDPATVEVARNLGANETQILRTVVIPASMPGILSGLRSSLQLSFLVTPVAEMIVGAIGLGGLIWRSADLFMVDLMVAGQITLGVLGLILMFIFRHVEVHYLTPWLPHRDSE